MGFPGLWKNFQDTPLIVWDCGLGAATNACVLLESLKTFPRSMLVIHSFDLTTEPLHLALQHPDKFPWLAALSQEQWHLLLSSSFLPWHERLWESPRRPAHEPAHHRQDADAAKFWKVHLGDFTRFVRHDPVPLSERPHLLFYDFHSPAKDWKLWTLEHWQALRPWCRDGSTPADSTRIVFHSRSTALRVTLLLAGFYVGPGTAIGSKEETTLASSHPKALPSLLGPEWLQRAFRSTAAQPITGPAYHQAPLELETRARLAAHPQFSDSGM
jgi:tRNA U34 5-methylaminomethyl-2-thiouridine-forming methyltransferase MnmC